MKRAICAVLGLLLAVSMTAASGCKSGGKTPGNNGEQVELVFSFWGQGDEKKVIEKTLKEFEEENPGIKVRTNHIPVDYLTKLTAMVAGNTLPDIGYFVESAVLPWAGNGQLLDLSDLFNDPTRMPEKMDMVRFITSDGKTVAASVANEVALLFYNKDIFDEAGLPYPPSRGENAWTWNEFVEVAKKLTKDRNGNDANSAAFDPNAVATYGACVPLSDLIFQPLMWSNGGGILSEDGSSITLNSPESVQALQAIQDLMYVHKAAPTPTVQSTMPVMSSALMSRTVAMQFDMQYALMSLHEAKEAGGLNYGVGVLPKFKEPVSINGGSPIVVFSSTKHPEEAKKLFEYLMNPDNVLGLINNGLWMPNEKQWYTDETLISKWVNDEVHTADYHSAVIDYTNQYVRPNLYYRHNKVTEIITTIWPAIEQIYLGSAPAAQAVETVMPNLEKLLAE